MRVLVAGLIASLLCAGPAFAQSTDDLLPVEQAFKLSANVIAPGRVALHWDIAKDYYLYRSRIKAKTAQTGLTLGALDLPDGKKKHDEFLGDVEVYHDTIDATLPYTLADTATKALDVTITVQGCHEVGPKICYPPNATRLTIDVPAASAPTPKAARWRRMISRARTT
jgi:thiol:disulfide interchange protein DsbD